MPSPHSDGMIVLRSDPESTIPYRGPLKRATVLIVGYDTDHETLYLRGKLPDAIKHARRDGLSLDPVPASSLCDSAMMELFGA